MSKAEEILKKHIGSNLYRVVQCEKQILAAMEEYASNPLPVGEQQSASLKLDKFRSIIANTPPETRKMIREFLDELDTAQPPAAEAVVFGKVFEWLHEWGLKPSGNIRYAGQWQDGVGNYYTVEQLKEFFDRDTKTKGGNQ